MPCPGGTAVGDGEALSIKSGLSIGAHLKVDVYPPPSEYVVMTRRDLICTEGCQEFKL